MNNKQKQNIINTSWELHSLVEAAYLAHPAGKSDEEWHEKQRLLLADMALHLLQTALKPDALPLDKLQNNLHAILTISDQFLPHAKLKQATDTIYAQGVMSD